MASASPCVLNINVGVLGHVDSGKTSLVGALSTTLSTAALDKHPQSKERGITLDLGFSSFTVPLPPHLKHLPYDQLQFTLVDCPGHASLIRTIIGGVQIIDMVLLVVDVTKGLQTQTAECLVIAEVATPHMVVALNKVDMLPEADRVKAIKRAYKKLMQTFQMTKFADATMVPVAAKPGSEANSGAPPLGVEELKQLLISTAQPVARKSSAPLLFSIDHCFPIRGQGTVMTGTVLQGSVAISDTVELPQLKVQRPVKSMQMFKRSVSKASAGDRVGICVTQLDPKAIERGLAAAPGTVPTFNAAIARVDKIRFYAGKVATKAKFHVSVGHSTVMAELHVFGLPDGQGMDQAAAVQQLMASLQQLATGAAATSFDFAREYVHQEELYGLEGRPVTSTLLPTEQEIRHHGPQWVLLKFDQPVTAPRDALVIGAKFDADIHGDACRLAFYGRMAAQLDASTTGSDLQRLRIFKLKERRGQIDRVLPDGFGAICKGLFKKESDLSYFMGLKVLTTRGEAGVIDGRFGQSGKFKVHFPGGLGKDRAPGDAQVVLAFKKYVFEKDKHKIRQ